MSALQYINITAEILCLSICLILLLCMATAEHKKEKLNMIFLSVVCCHIPLLIVDMIIFIYEGNAEPYSRFVFKAAYGLSFIFGAALLILFTRYLLEFIKITASVSRKTVFASNIAISVCGINIIFVVLTQFSGMYYSIDGSNLFNQGDWYFISQLSALLCIMINTGIMLAYRRHFGVREFIILLSYAALPTVAIVIQNMVDGTIASIDVAITLTILIFYAGIQSEQAKKLKQQEVELTNYRIDIMMSQIQPHFLYNTLTTIETFCYKDGKMAAKLVRDFSSYLRENMDSLTQKELVSFERELAHIKIYLEIEKLRFEERINIIYDFEVTDFYIPILTVQPLVENAVCHGITEKLLGGTVTIATRLVTEGIKIIVSDDGAGFDMTQAIPQDGRSHVGIKNVRERLYTQCGATLTMESEKGKGTVCAIIIPEGNGI